MVGRLLGATHIQDDPINKATVEKLDRLRNNNRKRGETRLQGMRLRRLANVGSILLTRDRTRLSTTT